MICLLFHILACEFRSYALINDDNRGMLACRDVDLPISENNAYRSELIIIPKVV